MHPSTVAGRCLPCVLSAPGWIYRQLQVFHIEIRESPKHQSLEPCRHCPWTLQLLLLILSIHPRSAICSNNVFLSLSPRIRRPSATSPLYCSSCPEKFASGQYTFDGFYENTTGEMSGGIRSRVPFEMSCRGCSLGHRLPQLGTHCIASNWRTHTRHASKPLALTHGAPRPVFHVGPFNTARGAQ